VVQGGQHNRRSAHLHCQRARARDPECPGTFLRDAVLLETGRRKPAHGPRSSSSKHNAMPTMDQAAVYSGTLHYLQAVVAAKHARWPEGCG